MKFKASHARRSVSRWRKTSKYTSLFAAGLTLLGSAASMAAVTSVEPITWNVIGLDSNKPDTVQLAPGVFPPKDFPVGARVCNDATQLTSMTATFVWVDNEDPVYLSVYGPGGLGAVEQTLAPVAGGGCQDVYYQIEIDPRVKAAFNNREGYYIEVSAGGETEAVRTPDNREFWIEQLVSQNRNAVLGYEVNGVLYTPGGTDAVPVYVGQTLDLFITGKTATQGYEQLEMFMNLPPELFRINSVAMTYSANAGTDPDAGTKLYADGCGWENDRTSSSYHNNLSCSGTGKYGGQVTLRYSVTVLGEPTGRFAPEGGTPGRYTGQTMIYDFSGSSYHYNSDYASGGLNFDWVAPPAILPSDLVLSKVGAPQNSQLSKFSITITNDGPNPVTSSTNAPIRVLDSLPLGYDLKNPSPTVPAGTTATFDGGGFNTNARDIVWTLNDGTTLGVGQSLTLELNVFYSGTAGLQASDFENCAELTHIDTVNGNLDADLSNNIACDSLPADPFDLSISKSVTPDPGTAGQAIFTFTVTNVSAVASDPAYIADSFPAGYTVVSTTGTELAGTVDPLVVWEVPALAAGASHTVTATVAVAPPVVGDNLALNYLNTAEVVDGSSSLSGGVFTKVALNDAETGNNQATAAFIPPLLQIVKDADGVLSGDIYDFTLRVGKLGGFAGGEIIVVTEVPPAGSNITAIGGDGWTCTPATSEVPADVPTQCSRTVSENDPTLSDTYPDINVTVGFPDPITLSSVQNTAYVQAFAFDPDTDGLVEIENTYAEDAAVLAVPLPLDFTLDKLLYEGSDSGAQCETNALAKWVTVNAAGDPVAYTWCFIVTNSGLAVFSTADVTLTDPALIGSLVAPAPVNLLPGDTAVWYVEDSRNSGLVNTAEASVQRDGDAEPLVREATATLAYVSDPPYGIKTGTVSGLNQISWTMVWINQSTVVAENVFITDQLPDNMTFNGNLVCEARGSSVIAVDGCNFNSAIGNQGRIEVLATMGADDGATNEATAENEVVISFDVLVPPSETEAEYFNQAFADWTPEGTLGPVALTGDSTDTPDGVTRVATRVLVPAAVAVPFWSPLHLLLMVLAVMALVRHQGRRSRMS
ncbi:MAG: hypothetical protein ACNA7T_11240 [Haliea sp.]